MSIILGLNMFHAGASACLVIDGVPVFAIAEERISRVKYFGGFPIEAIKACLAFANIAITDIDHVAIGRDPRANRGRKIAYAISRPHQALNFARIASRGRRFRGLKATLSAEFAIPEAKLRFATHAIEHHLAHIASAYFISPWDKSAGFSVDGSGDFVTTSLARCEGDRIDLLHRTFLPHSLGNLYSTICDLIGYPAYGDEGKVMGLAPYGEDSFRDLFDRLISMDGASFLLDPRYFLPIGSNGGITLGDDGTMAMQRQYSDALVAETGPPRHRDAEISQRDMDLAFGVQRKFEEIYLALLNKLHGHVGGERVAMAGGCALNSVANGKLLLDTPFTRTTIQPAAGDDGLAMGAALYVSNAVLKEGKRWTMVDAYLGAGYSRDTIKRALDAAGILYDELDEDALVDRTAEHIHAGEVIGWFQGREEWGPRALGNRSILVHPGYPGMKDILNSRIKRREWYRPFAPAVLAERQSEIFAQNHPSPFMLHVYKIRPEWRERIAACNHVDDTGRLQTVTREENPIYWKLISAFAAMSGVPVLLNTSFNENEPIVHTPDQAIACFMRTKMDVLAIGPFLCRKDRQKLD